MVYCKRGDRMTTGEKIRLARKGKGYTQKKLGELCGIAEPTIRRYELGKLNPKRETLEKISSALDVDWISLVDDDSVSGFPGLPVAKIDGKISTSKEALSSFRERIEKISEIEYQWLHYEKKQERELDEEENIDEVSGLLKTLNAKGLEKVLHFIQDEGSKTRSQENPFMVSSDHISTLQILLEFCYLTIEAQRDIIDYLQTIDSDYKLQDEEG